MSVKKITTYVYMYSAQKIDKKIKSFAVYTSQQQYRREYMSKHHREYLQKIEEMKTIEAGFCTDLTSEMYV